MAVGSSPFVRSEGKGFHMPQSVAFPRLGRLNRLHLLSGIASRRYLMFFVIRFEIASPRMVRCSVI